MARKATAGEQPSIVIERTERVSGSNTHVYASYPKGEQRPCAYCRQPIGERGVSIVLGGLRNTVIVDLHESCAALR